MSVSAVTNRRGSTPASTETDRPDGMKRRVVRALVLSGWLALILGQALGLLMTNPALLTDRLGFEIDPSVIALAGFGLAGLLIGLVAGLALRGASPGLRLAVGMFDVLLALITAEAAYGLLRGLPLDAALMSIRDDWKLLQAGLGIIMASLGVILSRPRQVSVSVSDAPAAPRASGRRQAAQPAASRPARASASASTPRRSSSAPAPASASGRGSSGRGARQTTGHGRQTTGHGRRRAPARAGSAPAASGSVSAASVNLSPAPKEKPARPAKKRKTLFSRRKVHLGKEQTAVCPYCLEEVRPNDPRGKVVCRICGTPHHADCWAITGKCEVPHLQT